MATSMAHRHLGKAMQMDADNADVWYMDAVFDKKNAKNDIIRAKSLKSYGVFTEEDMNLTRHSRVAEGRAYSSHAPS